MEIASNNKIDGIKKEIKCDLCFKCVCELINLKMILFLLLIIDIIIVGINYCCATITTIKTLKFDGMSDGSQYICGLEFGIFGELVFL